MTASASTWCFATPEDRAWWADTWVDRITASSLADQLVAVGPATTDDLADVADAFRSWAAHPGATCVVVHGEVLCQV